jgi:hypothetical protein
VALADVANTKLLAIWKRTDQQWLFSVQPATKLSIDTSADPQAGAIRQISVMAISRSGQESQQASVQLP